MAGVWARGEGNPGPACTSGNEAARYWVTQALCYHLAVGGLRDCSQASSRLMAALALTHTFAYYAVVITRLIAPAFYLMFAALVEAAADSLAVNHPYPSMGHLVHMPGHTYPSFCLPSP